MMEPSGLALLASVTCIFSTEKGLRMMDRPQRHSLILGQVVPSVRPETDDLARMHQEIAVLHPLVSHAFDVITERHALLANGVPVYQIPPPRKHPPRHGPESETCLLKFVLVIHT